MYITISPQKTGTHYAQSSADFVAYLEKENEDLSPEEQEHFFNQYGHRFSTEEVIQDIDANTAKLKTTEPKFYTITINPSPWELRHLQNHSEALKRYTRKVMQSYVKAFNQEIEGRAITVDDIKYYAKIEHQRQYKGSDKAVKENQPYATKILNLKHRIHDIEQGRAIGNTKQLQKEIDRLEKTAPHQQNGKRIVQGMDKAGSQSHIHIIVSRKDASNRYSLSPGSQYKASTVNFNGKTVKRGFHRDQFFREAEKTFDTTFGYPRNYAETYHARKLLARNPKQYFKILMGLPKPEKTIALKLIRHTNRSIRPNIPTDQAQLARKALKRLKRGMDKAMRSSSIGI